MQAGGTEALGNIGGTYIMPGTWALDNRLRGCRQEGTVALGNIGGT